MSDIIGQNLRHVPHSGEDTNKPEESLEEFIFYRNCLDKAAISIFQSDENGTIFSVNAHACKCLGYTQDELLALSVFDIDPVITRERMLELKKILDATGSITHESMHRRRDGTTFPVEITVNHLEFQGKVYGISFVRDITERKRAEDERRKSEENFSIIFQSTPDLIAITRADDGTILEVNEAFTRLLGYPRAEAIGKSTWELSIWADPTDRTRWMAALESTGQVDEFETTLRCRDGSLVTCVSTARPLDFKGEKCVLSVVRDITERDRLADDLLKAHAELESRVMERTGQISAITYELSIAEERERRRIAGELHDQVGQSLILSKLKLSSISSSMSPGELGAQLSEIREHLGKSIENIRSLTFQLSPPLLYEVGFEAAVEWLAEEFEEKFGLKVNFQDDKKPKPLDEKDSIILYQMVRELMINIAKHSRAKNVNISIVTALDYLRVIVADDGKGIDPAMSLHAITRNGTFGLFNIRHRIEHLGGNLKIESDIGCGTRIFLDLPLRQGCCNDGGMDDHQNHTR